MDYIDDKDRFYAYLFGNCSCVNAGQSLDERRLKYAIAKYLGANVQWARSLRDYRSNNFAKHFGYGSWESLFSIIKKEFRSD